MRDHSSLLVLPRHKKNFCCHTPLNSKSSSPCHANKPGSWPPSVISPPMSISWCSSAAARPSPKAPTTTPLLHPECCKDTFFLCHTSSSLCKVLTLSGQWHLQRPRHLVQLHLESRRLPSSSRFHRLRPEHCPNRPLRVQNHLSVLFGDRPLLSDGKMCSPRDCESARCESACCLQDCTRMMFGSR